MVCLVTICFIPGGKELNIFPYTQGIIIESKLLRDCEQIHGARTNWSQEMMKFKEQPEELANGLSKLPIIGFTWRPLTEC